jgi:hypothetical protein
MLLNELWDLFTYFFRFLKINRRPEYSKVIEDHEDELEYDRLNDLDTPVYSFVMVRD